MTLLAGRTALVTGAASGIGAAMVARLAADGASVLAVDRDEAGVKALAAACPVEPVACDLSDLDAVDALPAEVDVLVNNAGLQHVAPVQEFDPGRFSLILRVMLEAPFRLARASCRTCTSAAGAGSINISSAHGLRASPFKSAYVSAKHGLEGLSKVIALEGADARRHQQLRQPGLRAHAAGREADRRPGPRPRDRRGRGRREDHARPRWR